MDAVTIKTPVPYEPISLVVAAIATVLLVAVHRAAWPLNVRVSVLLLAAFAIRLDPAWDRSLHPWDERYHALVAKHLMATPLTPTLYERALLPYDHRDWTANHIWLHKPPGALWMMAAGMRTFGVNAIAARMPSVLLSTASVMLTFTIARSIFGMRIGLLAATFQAVNGFLVALAAGRRVADHVDTALIFFVEVGIALALRYQDDRRRWILGLAGVAMGAGLMSKSWPGLLVVPVAFAFAAARAPLTSAIRQALAILAIGLLVAMPWAVSTYYRFPIEARWSGLYTLMHASQTLEGQVSDWATYARDMPRFFGDLVWIPVVAGVVAAWRRTGQMALRPIVVWTLIPYVTFSAMATRLPGYVMIAAPAIFIMQAWFWYAMRDTMKTVSSRPARAALALLLALLLALPARYLLEPSGVFERRNRRPPATRELEQLSSRLKLADAVVFNMPRPIEAMFYSPFVVYPQMPTTEEVQRLRAAGIPVVIYEPAGARVEIPKGWDVIVLRQLAPD